MIDFVIFIFQAALGILLILLMLAGMVRWVELTVELYGHMVNPEISSDKKLIFIPVLIIMGIGSFFILVLFGLMAVSGVLSLIAFIKKL